MADALINADCEVKAVEAQIAAVERALLEPNADISYLRKEKDQLRKKEEQIREEKKQIRKEKEQILNGINLDKEKLNIELKIRQSPGTRPCKQLSSYFLLFNHQWFNSDVL